MVDSPVSESAVYTHPVDIHVDSPQSLLSKKQQRRQRRKELWSKIKAEKKTKKKENSECQVKRDSLSAELGGDLSPPKKLQRSEFVKLEKAKFIQKCSEGPTVVIDCEFDDLLTEKETQSLLQQAMYTYGANKRAESPVSLVFSGISSSSKIHSCFSKLDGWKEWPVKYLEGNFIEEVSFPKHKIVYLSSEGTEELSTFSSDEIYVIGGIVDRNRLKGTTKAKADSLGLRTAFIPISAHCRLNTSCVLTVNQVFDIILAYQQHQNWRTALLSSIAPRKFLLEAGVAEAKKLQTPCLPRVPKTPAQCSPPADFVP
eukprot:GHVR01003192.1.p1 GENE.GHVR01003192.1~~GHVR01003192.1.p1  ORF type:complete len:314 (+),score=39.43 GHVR01003192.1:54-995(+)